MSQKPPSTGSHPVIEFRQIPITHGPLSRLDDIRPRLLNDVVKRTLDEFSNSHLEGLLGEAFYSERLRLKRNRGNIFTKSRDKADRVLWNSVLNALVNSPAEVDRKLILEKVVKHYANEIGGHFDPRIYRIATRAVPYGFSWLLNAATVKRFLPWGMTESLESCIHIQGEVPTLQKLAKKGTILLVPTHQSNIDSVLIGYVIYLMSLPPFAYGAGLNLFKNPALSFFMSRLGAYTVDRQKANEIYKETLKNYSYQILKEGIHSIFFPGGGRSRSGAIESKVKLGLLGTGLEAQLERIRTGNLNSRVFIVPMVMSYHFVLEASTLIEDYLAESGKHKYLLPSDESWQASKILNFFWKCFSSQTGVTVRIGKPLDIFGNFVDEEGQSIGPNGTTIDPVRWLTTRGELRADPQRDHEYTRELGVRLVDRFHRENTVLTSHLVAFVYFETLRKKYPEFDLYRFLRLTTAQRSMPLSEFLVSADHHHQRLLEFANRGELYLCNDLRTSSTEKWVENGVQQLGLMHDSAVVKIYKDRVWTDDMNLLYYYRNRLTGYGLSLLADGGTNRTILRHHDSKGFLA
jgi:glycerol-3-phosphate O-acyltransferase